MIVFERASLLFIFNFNPTKSFADYRVGVEEEGEYKVALSSDEKRFGGLDRIDLNGSYFTTPLAWNNRKNFVQASRPRQNIVFLASLTTVTVGLHPFADMPCSCKVRPRKKWPESLLTRNQIPKSLVATMIENIIP
jgi:hypothetical protein